MQSQNMLVTITGLAKTKAGRYSVYADGEYAFSLDGKTLLESDIRKGRQLDWEYLEQVRQKSQYESAREKALNLLGSRELSAKELEQKLRLHYPAQVCTSVVQQLQQVDLIDDGRYAMRLAAELYRVRHCSVWEIGQQLRARGIAGAEYDAAMDQGFDDVKTLQVLLQGKYAAAWQRDAKKCAASLRRKGFAFGDIAQAMDLGEE